MRLSVIIPVLNEEKTIEKILRKVLSQNVVSEVVVVDDGSTDTTPQILNRVKRPRGKKIKIVTHKKNQGKGAALRTGLKEVSGDLVIIQDADLEYNPQEYEKLLKHASGKRCVYGSRIKSNSPHAYERTYWGNVLMTSLCNILYGTSLTDSYTCYKLMPTRLVRKLKLSSNGFEVEAEVTAKLAKMGIEIIEVPITFKPRSYKKGKKIKAKDALLGAYALAKYKFV